MCLLKLNKEIKLSGKSLGREFHAAGAEKPKLRFVLTRGISIWPDLEDHARVVERQTLCRRRGSIFGGQGIVIIYIII